MTIFLNVIFFIFLVLLTSVNAKEQNPNIICSNYNKSILLEFLFINQSNYFDDDVFKKINSKFIKIGKIVGQKPKLFILFEDKYAFLGVDFAWHLDKKTMKLKPVLLSEGMIKLKKMPEELSCINKK
jgi:hypothetical protein